jgi:hypothetical protein
VHDRAGLVQDLGCPLLDRLIGSDQMIALERSPLQVRASVASHIALKGCLLDERSRGDGLESVAAETADLKVFVAGVQCCAGPCSAIKSQASIPANYQSLGFGAVTSY